MQRIGFIVLPGFQMLSLSSLSVFELANWEIGEPVYDVHLLSETGGSIRSSAGISVATELFDDRNFDTLMVGGSVVAGALTPGVIKFLRQGLERLENERGGDGRRQLQKLPPIHADVPPQRNDRRA